MAASLSNKLTTSKIFIISGLFLLAAGMIFGVVGALQYVIPGFLKENLSFEKIRPLHVSSVVFWIIICASGAVITYLQEHSGKKIYSPVLLKIQLILFLLSILFILISYCMGVFGGREYWEFPPILSLPIVVGWIIFLINFMASSLSLKNQPVYVWMWMTGIIFFLLTFLESYLWIFPYFRNNVVNDMTIQWKSYGSMVGSWNMLIYGSSIYLMDKISGNKNYSSSGIAFALYFTGLLNLIFNWGHHIYTLPTYPFIKHISYFISMTELFILGRIIFKWRSSLNTAKKYFHHTSYMFLMAADVWIFLNLILAILMSLPAINLFTHGTHITVAHTMGATIGINTMLLLAFAADILRDTCVSFEPYKKMMQRGCWLANGSLFFFWLSLIVAGILKAKWQMSLTQVPFSVMMIQLKPFFIIFLLSGITMMVGILMAIYPLVKNQLACYFIKSDKKNNVKNFELNQQLVFNKNFNYPDIQ